MMARPDRQRPPHEIAGSGRHYRGITVDRDRRFLGRETQNYRVVATVETDLVGNVGEHHERVEFVVAIAAPADRRAGRD